MRKNESLAIAIYENNRNMNGSFIIPWQDLSEELKNSNRDQAKNIPNVLLKINYDIVSVKEKPAFIEFTIKELGVLAEKEHMRWYHHRKKVGFKYGEVEDNKKKINHALVPWDKLTEEKKNKVYQMIKIWPEILAKSNFKIEPLKVLCHCESKLY
ncbi:hypothetical protein G9F72_007435 [Clostridium estertheticum]|uniref:RyR domain-containing protein n=1 Tax=Clostridium estertheticum TaxID=238834 RepID=UPI001CD186D2|nr:RyR domain-containing protein [Clostridium estertheticum]MBZ9686162.1 hypothetical protein [Clostridium estertheticum]